MCVYRLGSVTASQRPVGCSQLMGSLLSSLILFFWRGQWRCVSNLNSNSAFLDKCILHWASPLVCVGLVVWCRANHALDSEGLSEELLYGSQKDARKKEQMGARLARTGVCLCVCVRALYVCLCTCSNYMCFAFLYRCWSQPVKSSGPQMSPEPSWPAKREQINLPLNH